MKLLTASFNTTKDNIIRNNNNIDLYPGEWVKIRVNDFRTHIVKPTETLDKISQMYERSKENLIRDNNLHEEKLFIGQILKIYQ